MPRDIAPRIDFGIRTTRPTDLLIVRDPEVGARLGRAMADQYREELMIALALLGEAKAQLERERQARFRIVEELRAARAKGRAA